MARKLLLILCLIITPFYLYAGIYGVLKGRITNKETGEPVVGASVFIEGTRLGAYAKSDGRFTITNVSPGTYNVRITAVGYAKQVVVVNISADEVTEINVKLAEEGKVTEEITVVAQRNMVEKTQIGDKQKFDNTELTAIARESVQSIVGLSVGVFNAGDGFIVRGARPTETQIRVDGLDVGNQFTGGFGLGGLNYYPMVSTYATEEVQVLTGGFSAEYGDAMGGIVNTVVRTGSTDRYDGFFRYRTEFGALWGSQEKGLQIIREEGRMKAYRVGEGAKLVPSGEHKFEFGVGGPIPLFNKSTFFITGSYFYEKYRNASYEIYDPIGNNLSKLPHNQSWVKNLTGRLKFALSNDIDFLVGGTFGMSNFEFSSWGWLYARTEGIINGQPNGIPEYMAKLPVGNQNVSNAMVRITHRLSEKSFYEFTVSNTSNNDETAKRASFGDPNFWTGFELVTPQDDYVVEGSYLVKKFDESGRLMRDKILDQFQFITKMAQTEDKYLTLDLPTINNLTGYIEGAANASPTKNPYGLPYFFNYHGNERTFEFRKGNYWQVDGNYNLSIDGGDQGFSHLIKTGFEFRFYTQRRHQNSLPWDGNPFFDVYTEEWGGNLYADNDEVKAKTSKPYKPYRGAFYVQDQISYKGIIISPGIRFDYFNPNSNYRTQRDVFVSIRSDTGFAKAEGKVQISPRLNITYPITDRSNISIAYGLYYKMPELQTLYDGFAIDQLRGNAVLGDPNIGVQRNNAYQISFNNQISDNYAIVISAYYRDVYNQLGMSYVPATPVGFYQYTVNEYGNSKGLEITFRKRPTYTDHFGFNINYNLSKTVGTSPSAGSNYLSAVDPYTDQVTYPLTELTMPYDRRHRVNAIINFAWFDRQGPSIAGIRPLENTQINLSGFFQTGLPYTKLDKAGRAIGEYNSERQPNRWSMDLRIQKAFLLRDIFGEGAKNASLEIFFDIYNLLNNRSVVAFYARTGDPIDDGVTFERQAGDFSGTAYYKEANYGLAQTFSTDQYDSYGQRLYSEYADFDKNGIVTQDEKFLSYINYVRTVRSFQGNFASPRTVYFGLMFRF